MMRQVEEFELGTVMTTGATEKLIVVAKNNVFSHTHYIREYPTDSFRELYCNTYTASRVEKEVLKRQRPGYYREKTIEYLKKLGCYSGNVGYIYPTHKYTQDEALVMIEEYPESDSEKTSVLIEEDQFDFSTKWDAEEFVRLVTDPKYFQ